MLRRLATSEASGQSPPSRVAAVVRIASATDAAKYQAYVRASRSRSKAKPRRARQSGGGMSELAIGEDLWPFPVQGW
jgi:hypothetical protein